MLLFASRGVCISSFLTWRQEREGPTVLKARRKSRFTDMNMNMNAQPAQIVNKELENVCLEVLRTVAADYLHWIYSSVCLFAATDQSCMFF